MAAVAPPPDNPPSSTTPTITVMPTATFTSTPPNPATPCAALPNPNRNLPPAPLSVVSAPPVMTPRMPPAPVSFTASFRPLGAPPPQSQQQQVPQYGAVPNPGYPMTQSMQPPGAVRPPPHPGSYMQQPGAAIPHPAVVVAAFTPYRERCQLIFDSAALDQLLPH